jgi:hypothetical protein
MSTTVPIVAGSAALATIKAHRSLTDTGGMHFVECLSRDGAEGLVVGRVDPAVVGNLHGERAQLGGDASGHVGNAALCERAGHRSGEAERFHCFTFL